MALFNRCRRCGRANPGDATICTTCQQPLNSGITSAMNCPVCGTNNAAGSHTCSLCGSALVTVDQTPYNQRTLVCPYCRVANPRPPRSDASAYCIRCGRQIKLPGPNYSMTDAQSPSAVARQGADILASSSTPGFRSWLGILFGLGLLALVLPGLSAETRSTVVPILWLGIPAVMLAIRGGLRRRRTRRNDASSPPG